MKNLKTGLLVFSLTLGSAALLSGCAKEETAGDKVDEAIEKTEDAAEEVKEGMEDAAEKLSN